MFLLACAPPTPPVLCPEACRASMRIGDVVTREGTGRFSSLFAEAGGTDSPYSHTGIVVARDGGLAVAHADAEELTGTGFVRVDEIGSFFAAEAARSGAVLRLEDPVRATVAAEFASRAAASRVAFDSDFDASDPSRLYCTELVWRAFLAAGVDLLPASPDPPRLVTVASIVDSPRLGVVQRLRTEDKP